MRTAIVPSKTAAKITTQTIQRSGPMINETFIGVDTALRLSGVCVLAGKEVDLHLIDTKGLQGACRLSSIGDAIREILSKRRTPTLGVIEGGAYLAGGRVFQLGQAQGVAQLELYRAGVRLIEVPPSRLKKFFVGNGNAPKEKMQESADKALGTHNINDNLADAYALARIGEVHHTKRPMSRKQAEVILDVEIEEVL